MSAGGRSTAARVPKTGRRGEYGGGEADLAVSLATNAPGTRRVVPQSLDLRGARVDEALELLEGYIDSASLGHAGQVTVIHGHGSGALRDAVRARLSAHPLVQSWRPGERGEGGDGATIVRV
jgi:DNA mismatch repair protein MutS2